MVNDGRHAFTYDFANQPVSISGAVTGSFRYDAHKKRVQQSLASKTVYSFYDSAGAVSARDQVTDAKTVGYVAVAGLSVARIENGAVEYVYVDHLGSTVVRTDPAAVRFGWEVLTPFGERWSSASANDDEPLYTGHVYDAG